MLFVQHHSCTYQLFTLFIYPPPPPVCLHAMYFCDFLREEFIEMRVLQPDGSASTSLFSLPACASPHLLALLSALFQTSLCLIHRGENLGGSAKPEARASETFCFIICLIRDLSSLGKARLPFCGRLLPEVVCSGRPPVWICAQPRTRIWIYFIRLLNEREIQTGPNGANGPKLAGPAAGRGDRRLVAMCCLQLNPSTSLQKAINHSRKRVTGQ